MATSAQDAYSPPTIRVRMCAWCGAVKLRGVYYHCPAIPPLDATADGVSHGICPSCRAALEADVDRRLA